MCKQKILIFKYAAQPIGIPSVIMLFFRFEMSTGETTSETEAPNFLNLPANIIQHICQHLLDDSMDIFIKSRNILSLASSCTYIQSLVFDSVLIFNLNFWPHDIYELDDLISKRPAIKNFLKFIAEKTLWKIEKISINFYINPNWAKILLNGHAVYLKKDLKVLRYRNFDCETHWNSYELETCICNSQSKIELHVPSSSYNLGELEKRDQVSQIDCRVDSLFSEDDNPIFLFPNIEQMFVKSPSAISLSIASLPKLQFLAEIVVVNCWQYFYSVFPGKNDPGSQNPKFPSLLKFEVEGGELTIVTCPYFLKTHAPKLQYVEWMPKKVDKLPANQSYDFLPCSLQTLKTNVNAFEAIQINEGLKELYVDYWPTSNPVSLHVFCESVSKAANLLSVDIFVLTWPYLMSENLDSLSNFVKSFEKLKAFIFLSEGDEDEIELAEKLIQSFDNLSYSKYISISDCLVREDGNLNRELIQRMAVLTFKYDWRLT